MKNPSLPPPSPSIEQPSGSGKLLIVDNYDSNTYNIRQVLGELGFDSDVYRNDELSLADVHQLNPSHIILGPGPGTPENRGDIGICPYLLTYGRLHNRALLGICLGQQIMVHQDGGTIDRAPRPMHGKTSPIQLRKEFLSHLGHYHTFAHPSLFKGINTDVLQVMRYHSLKCNGRYGSEYEDTAFATDVDYSGGSKMRISMALQHQKLPHYGVQFHPESLFTEHGPTMLRNFAQLNGGAKKSNTSVSASVPEGAPSAERTDLPSEIEEYCRLHLDDVKDSYQSCEFPCDLPPGEVYEHLHATGKDMYCFESIAPDEKGDTKRYSYFGFDPSFVLSACNEKLFFNGEEVSTGDGTPLDVLERLQKRLTATPSPEMLQNQLLSGGLAGFFSYESMQYQEPSFPGRNPAHEPTFSFGYFQDGLIYDHAAGKYYRYIRGTPPAGMPQSSHHFDCLQTAVPAADPAIIPLGEENGSESFQKGTSAIIDREIKAGNAQQVVFSRRKYFDIQGSTAPLYRRYRELYPSANMHAIRIGDMESIGSFPELMMRIQNGECETTNLAGTASRTGDPEKDAQIFLKMIADEKEVAEHRMLVDLSRNDVGRLSALGTVKVLPNELLFRKDAGPVMHIASTIRGRLAPGLSAVRAHAHIAPMGTVSGAPKIRATQIIHEYEQGRSRGIYAGSIGFFDATGNAEFVIGLRNIVRRGNILCIQTGAGIVYDSVPEKEFAETEAKAKAPLTVMKPFLQ